MIAVIRTGGKQYTVAADDTLTVEKIEGEAGAKICLLYTSDAADE